MHRLVKFGVENVEVFERGGESFVLKNKPGILNKLKLENDLDFIEGYIECAREQVCVYHDDIKKTREKLLKVLGASAGAIALAGEICCISAASDIISSVSNQFMVAPLTPDNPIVGTAIIGSTILGGWISLFSSWFFSSVYREDYPKMKKAATISCALGKYYLELSKKLTDGSFDSCDLITNEEHILLTGRNPGADESAHLQYDLGLCGLWRSWYDWNNSRSLRERYGVSKAEVSKHLKEIVAAHEYVKQKKLS